MAEVYTPIYKELPQVQTFFEGIRKLLPESCGLDAFEERKELPPPPPPPLRVQTPSEKVGVFVHLSEHFNPINFFHFFLGGKEGGGGEA